MQNEFKMIEDIKKYLEKKAEKRFMIMVIVTGELRKMKRELSKMSHIQKGYWSKLLWLIPLKYNEPRNLNEKEQKKLEEIKEKLSKMYRVYTDQKAKLN